MTYIDKTGIEIIFNPKNIFNVKCDPYVFAMTIVPINGPAEILQFDNQNEYENFKNWLLERMVKY